MMFSTKERSSASSGRHWLIRLVVTRDVQPPGTMVGAQGILPPKMAPSWWALRRMARAST